MREYAQAKVAEADGTDRRRAIVRLGRIAPVRRLKSEKRTRVSQRSAEMNGKSSEISDKKKAYRFNLASDADSSLGLVICPIIPPSKGQSTKIPRNSTCRLQSVASPLNKLMRKSENQYYTFVKVKMNPARAKLYIINFRFDSICLRYLLSSSV